MRGSILILAAALALAGLALLPYTSLGQPAEDQAYQAFVQAGCTNCHNGGAAPDWNDTVATIIEWAQKYDNIDDTVANEYGAATSYDELMEQMRSYTPGITDEQYQILYNFFLDLFNYYAQQSQTTTTTSQPPATTTQPPPTNTTTGQPGNQTTTTPPGGGSPSCQPSTVTVTVTKTKTVTETLTKYVEHTVTKLQDICRPNPYAEEKPSTAAYAPVVATILILVALAYVLLQAR